VAHLFDTRQAEPNQGLNLLDAGSECTHNAAFISSLLALCGLPSLMCLLQETLVNA
jgi:hypothetical protein